EALHILQLESELDEIVRLVGVDALSRSDRLTLEVARMLREDFLQQDAMSDTDAYCPLDKQYGLLRLILTYRSLASDALAAGANLKDVLSIGAIEKIGRAKSEADYQTVYPAIDEEMIDELSKLAEGSLVS
ncbi:MAG: V-type ATP synthase subunit A, partial [Clostridiales bacterium]|nr:V-type ATP synthase subunit A [Clostridiales bacterium]